MTKAKKISKGDTFICQHPRLGTAIPGKVIALTTDETKQIGLQFEQNVNGHSCDGRGPDGHCLWVRPQHILTLEEYEQEQKVKLAAAESLAAADLEELILE